MTYKKAIRKRKLEYIGMLPFVWCGKLYGKLFPLKQKTSVFIFSPSADLGGSIKVNADIARCLAKHDPLLIFSKVPHNQGYLQLFQGLQILDLHKQIDYKVYHVVNFFYRGVLAQWINHAPKAVVFGGESLFFYKMLPHLRPDVRRIELCHLDTWLPYSLGFAELITYRVFSTLKLKEKVMDQYQQHQMPPDLAKRLRFIENKIDLPPYSETSNGALEVLFVGRGAPQKRVHLIAAIAQQMHDTHAPVHFSFVGDVDRVIPRDQFSFCTFYGNVNDESKMQTIYRQSDVLLLTSAYEGLPIVVMQMMAYGRVVVSTAVNSIPDYISHGQNGLLIRATREQEIIEEGVNLLRELAAHPELRTSLGKKSREIALEKFNGEQFCQAYHRLFFE
jgi:L-malate glycosyltransferase